MVIPVKMEGAKADYQWGLLEQSTAPTHVDGVLVARTLVNIQKEPVPLRVVNLSRHQRVIKKGTELACCETVTSVHTAEANLCEQLIGGGTGGGRGGSCPPTFRRGGALPPPKSKPNDITN